MSKINKIKVNDVEYDISLTNEEGKSIVESNLLTKTAVPNSGYVDKVYFNYNLSAEEIFNVLKQINFIEGTYIILGNVDGTNGLFVTINGDINSNCEISVMDLLDNVYFVLGSDGTNFELFQYINTFEFNAEVTGLINGINMPIGFQNDLIKDLVYVQSEKYTTVEKVESYLFEGEEAVTVPNSGEGSDIYINYNLSAEEVRNVILNNLAWYSEGNLQYYVVCSNSDYTKAVSITYYNDIIKINLIKDNSTITVFNEEENGWIESVVAENNPYVFDGTFVNYYDNILEAHVGLQNALISKLFSLTPNFGLTEKYATVEKVNEVVESHLFEEKKNQAIPITGYLDKVYFNTNMTDEEIESLYNEVFPNAPSIHQYLIAVDKTLTKLISFNKGAGAGSKGLQIKFAQADKDTDTIIWNNQTAATANGLSVGWQTFENPIEFNAELIEIAGITGDKETNEAFKDLVYCNIKNENYATPELVESYIYEKEPIKVPSSGEVKTIYFNTDLTPPEVDNYLSQLTYVEFNGLQVNVLFSNATLTNVIFAIKFSDGTYQINHSNNITDGQFTKIYYSDDWWALDKWEINDTGITEAMGISIGAENDIVKNVVNIGYEKEEKYATKDEVKGLPVIIEKTVTGETFSERASSITFTDDELSKIINEKNVKLLVTESGSDGAAILVFDKKLNSSFAAGAKTATFTTTTATFDGNPSIHSIFVYHYETTTTVTGVEVNFNIYATKSALAALEARIAALEGNS